MIILPHIEKIETEIDEVMDAGMGRLGHRVKIFGTLHKTNSRSLPSLIAHTLVDVFPDIHEEKADKKGVSCSKPK